MAGKKRARADGLQQQRLDAFLSSSPSRASGSHVSASPIVPVKSRRNAGQATSRHSKRASKLPSGGSDESDSEMEGIRFESAHVSSSGRNSESNSESEDTRPVHVSPSKRRAKGVTSIIISDSDPSESEPRPTLKRLSRKRTSQNRHDSSAESDRVDERSHLKRRRIVKGAAVVSEDEADDLLDEVEEDSACVDPMSPVINRSLLIRHRRLTSPKTYG